ncbi:MAG: ATP-binding protein, partial [bacterium]
MRGILSKTNGLIKGKLPYLSLRWKTLLIVLPLIIVTFVAFTLLHILANRNHLISNTEHFLYNLVHQLRFNVARSYEIDNSRSLFQFVTECIAYDSRIVNIRIVRQGGEITADSDPNKIFAVNTDPEVDQILSGEALVLRRYSQDDKEYYKIIVPIYVWESNIVSGALVLQYDASQMFLAMSRLQTVGIIGSLVIIILSGVGITWFLERGITGPLSQLTQYVSHVDILKPSVPNMEIKSKDEIGTLARSFTQLLQNLEQANAELTRRTAEIEQAYQQLKETQVQLIQSEKMASLGQLTAGIAHEVNNPMNFVYGNLGLIEKYFHEMKLLLQTYEKAKVDTKALKSIRVIKKAMDYETILNDLKGIITDCKTGAKRTVEIVQELRNFSRMDGDEVQTININESLDTTLKLLQPNFKDRIKVIREYNNLPPYSCHSGHINQVFMNVIMNAIQAIEGQGSISIRTLSDRKRILVEISDTGRGIPKEIAHKIFDPFYTTKEIGKGTGLGLSISYRIVQQHRGSISFDSQVGKGTCVR